MASNDVRRSGSEKGVFDHLAEYLLQQKLPEAEASSAAIGADEAPAAPIRDQAPPLAPSQASLPAPAAGEPEMRSQELVFAETAEQLVVEKEVVVREEVVLSKLVQDRVETIDDKVKRTEVEVERISPEGAKEIAQPSRPEVQAPPAPLPEKKHVPPVKQQAAPAPGHSKAWWAWFALILCAAVLIAFAVGQFLGSAG